MRVGQNIDTRVSATLTMTPRLQQAIRLLQLSVTELSAYINEQIAENPLLVAENNEQSFSEDSNQEFSSDHDRDSFSEPLQVMERDPMEEGNGQNPRLRCEQTLQDHLTLQLSVVAENDEEYKTGLILIHCLNSRGYLEIEAQEIAEQFRIHLSLVEKMIGVMQGFDPVGVFARNIEECLRIQLKEKNALTDGIDTLLKNLEGLLQENPHVLAKRCNLSVAELQECLAVLRELNPHPASGFLINTDQDHVIPDGFIQKNADNKFIFELNLSAVPQVLLNSGYYHELRDRLKKPEEKQFLQAKFAHANWLMQALNQRLMTLKRVGNAIAQHQQEFFLKGMVGLKSLTLKMIADQLDMHESTISRVTTSKYVSTPQGTFELKFFFSQSLVSISDGAEDVSAKSVQNAILDLVRNESQSAPLSDEQLVGKLGEKGMLIARRTISKYRKILKIPSSQERRNYYMLGLKKIQS